MSNEISVDELHGTLLEILKVIDQFCLDHNIMYIAYYGTLLGAVRHQGFIPWDDDIDIAMERNVYNRFVEEWEKHPVDGYSLQRKENNPRYPYTFSKITKINSTFLEDESQIDDYDTGCYVDIFVADRIPNVPIVKWFYQCVAYVFVKLTYHKKCYDDSKLAYRMLTQIRETALSIISKTSRNYKWPTVFLYETRSFLHVTASNLFAETIKVKFEDMMIPIPNGYDEVLRSLYGDYMQLPPKEEQTWTHRPILLDLKKSLKEIIREKNLY